MQNTDSLKNLFIRLAWVGVGFIKWELRGPFSTPTTPCVYFTVFTVSACMFVCVRELIRVKPSYHDISILFDILYFTAEIPYLVMRSLFSFWFTDCRKTNIHTIKMTFKSFAFCTVNVQMPPDLLTWQSLKTTFQNSTPKMICDPIKNIYSSSQQTHKVSHQKTLYR